MQYSGNPGTNWHACTTELRKGLSKKKMFFMDRTFFKSKMAFHFDPTQEFLMPKMPYMHGPLSKNIMRPIFYSNTRLTKAQNALHAQIDIQNNIEDFFSSTWLTQAQMSCIHRLICKTMLKFLFFPTQSLPRKMSCMHIRTCKNINEVSFLSNKVLSQA